MLQESQIEAVKECILTNHKEQLWDVCYQTMKQFELIKPGDHISVGIAGDRSSLLLHACLELYKEIEKVEFKVSNVLIPNENATVEELIQITREWGIEEYHIVEDRTEEGYLNYMRGLGCNKLAVNLNRDTLIKEYMLRLLEYKEFFKVAPMYNMVRRQYFTAIHPFYFVEEKDMDLFASDCKMHLYPVLRKVVSVQDKELEASKEENLDSINPFQLNVYEAI